MHVNNELISRLEKLARLQLPAAEQAKFAGDLNQILEMVDKLLELDTTGVEPLAYPTAVGTAWREDVIGPQFTQKAALKNAPEHDDQFFRVPKIIE